MMERESRKRVEGCWPGAMAMPALLAACLGCAAPSRAFDSGKAGFSIQYKGETSPYRVSAVFLMPGETLDLQVAGQETGGFLLAFGDGVGGPDSSRSRREAKVQTWKWKAPDTARPSTTI